MQIIQDAITPPTAPPAAWCGWYRRRGQRWRQLATGADYDACWGALIDALGSERGGDSTVLPTGENPNRGASERRPVASH